MLTNAVSLYQGAKGLTGKAAAGQVDQTTFLELDKDFSNDYRVERDTLGKQKSADLLAQTQKVDATEKGFAARAISTEVKNDPVTGLPPTFKEKVKVLGKDEKYEDRLRALTEARVVAEYNALGKDKAAAHADPTKLFDWTTIDAIAVESQRVVDAVFGEYTKAKSPPPLKSGVNIKDAWTDKEATLTAGGKAQEDAAVAWRVDKIFTGQRAVAQLDAEHGAIQSRAAEKAIVDRVRAAVIAKYRTELLETHKGWPGFASGGSIFIQRFKSAGSTQNRREMWHFFQTFIHEYIHTLEDPALVAYRGGLEQQKGGFTLREGTTDYFTKIVWSSVVIDDALRKKIEGPFYDAANKLPIPPLTTYKESANAERLAGIVGVRNLAAAFFLGKVELIGK